jgi:hypothetical protein
VALTPAGVTTKASLQAGIYDPPPELLALPLAALETLLEAVAQLPKLSGGAGERPEPRARAREAEADQPE